MTDKPRYSFVTYDQAIIDHLKAEVSQATKDNDLKRIAALLNELNGYPFSNEMRRYWHRAVWQMIVLADAGHPL